MRKARIALIAASVAIVLLTILYVTATGTYLGPAATKLIMLSSLAMMEASAVLRIIDDRRSGRPVTAGVVFAVMIVVIAVSGIVGE